ncbi:thermonuclease family protein [Bradyrhizobium sp. 14AA]
MRTVSEAVHFNGVYRNSTDAKSHNLFMSRRAAELITKCASKREFEKGIGQASVIDGDTLEIHGKRIRLWAIHAPESSQLCHGDDNLPYRCGAKAANELGKFIVGEAGYGSPIRTN